MAAPAGDPSDLERLQGERVAVVRQVERLASQFDRLVEAGELVATDDEHDPEGPTTAYERQQVAALLRDARVHLADLDSAVARVRNRTYGRCLECGAAIGAERLGALPGTRRCIACAS